MKQIEQSEITKSDTIRISDQYKNGQLFHSINMEIATEVPVALVYNGISHVVMMMTPQNIEAFVIGFSLSEQIITSPNDIYGIDIHTHSQGIEVAIELSSRQFMALKARRRALVGRTGCGICGIEQLNEIYQPINTLPETQQFSLTHLSTLIAQLDNEQLIRQKTKCTHAAGWADTDGNLLGLCEDIGRHNALDKLLGMKAKYQWQSGIAIVSSRASYEMVKKAAVCGVEILCSLSAATSFAIDIAQVSGLTLVSRCQSNQAVIHSHPHRVRTE